MKTNYAIEVHDVKKSFFLPSHKNDSLKSAITQMFKSKEKGGSTFNALNGVSFNVEKGDFFGILGRNGSGKSTLLKIISEIYQPTKGSVRHNGKLVSFIELGVGFKPELTGRENVFLNGALLGFSNDEIEQMYDDIVGFAELEQFMDQKLKNYSSGMKVRLAFSVAIRAHADILILDEVLAVGDAAFQKKCNDYFQTLKDDGKTVVLVTHSMSAVREYCNKAVIIEGGKVIYEGDAIEAASQYANLFIQKNTANNLPSEDSTVANKVDASVALTSSSENLDLDIKLHPEESLSDPIIAVLIYQGGKQVYRWVSDEELETPIDLIKNKNFKAHLRIQNIFPVGHFTVDILVRSKDRSVDYAYFGAIAEFKVVNQTEHKHKTLWRPAQVFTIRSSS